MAAPGRVHLTFDDGPHPVWTPLIAAELERVGVRATFFVIGAQAEEHPDLVRELVASGHEVELHCMRHDAHEEGRREAAEADARAALGVLAELGVRPRWWRPPGGRLASWTRAVAHEHGLRVAGWSSDPRDWDEGALAGPMLERVAPDLGAGSVVLMHDGRGDDPLRVDRSQTVELVEPLVGAIRARGWVPGPLGDGVGAWLRWGRPVNSAVRARNRLRTDAAAGQPLELSIVDEADLGAEDLRALSELLVASMTRLGHEYAERPWRRVRPEFRVLARLAGRVVGQVSMFRVATDPERVLYGFGDLAVAPEARGRGIAGALMGEPGAECMRRGAHVLIADTTAVKPALLRKGYAPVPRFRFWYERDGACHWHPNWVARIHHPDLRARIQLAEGDF